MNKDAVAEMSQQYQVEAAEKLVPEGYKQTEVGVIPEDWSVKKLKDITLDMLQGINTAIDIPKYELSGVPMFKANNVIDQSVQVRDVDFVSEETYVNYSDRYKIKSGDFLFSNIGARLGTGSLFVGNYPCTFAWNIMKITPDINKVIPGFLAFLINSPAQSEKIKSEQSGSGMGFIPKSVMQNILVPVPSNLQEQASITNFLFNVDALLSELEKLIAKKQAIKTATMQQLLTGCTRLPQFANHPDGSKKGYKQSELGEIPEDWEIVPLGKLANIKTGSKNNQDKVADGVYPFFVRSETIERLSSYSYDCEAILVPGEGGIGSIFHYINGKFDAHQRVYVIRQFVNCSGKFVYFQMRQRFGAHAMENSVKATVDSLRLPTFQEFSMFLPSIEEQTAIATILSDMDEEIQALEQRLNKTRQIKQGMMQELLTGKTRLVVPQD